MTLIVDMDFEEHPLGDTICKPISAGNALQPQCQGAWYPNFDKCSGNCINITNEVPARIGNKCVRVYLNRLTQSPTYRSEAVPREKEVRGGLHSDFGVKHYWYRLSIRVPSPYQIDTRAEIFFQFHGSRNNVSGSPPVTFKVESENGGIWYQCNRSTDAAQRKVKIADLVLDTWIDVVFHAVWSYDTASQGDGLCEVWANGIKKIDYVGRNCYEELPDPITGERAAPPWPKWGNYKTAWRGISSFNENITERLYYLDAWAAHVGAEVVYNDIALSAEQADPDPQPNPTPDPDPEQDSDPNPDSDADHTDSFSGETSIVPLTAHVADTTILNDSYVSHHATEFFNVDNTIGKAVPTDDGALDSWFMGTPQQNVVVDLDFRGTTSRSGIFLRLFDDGIYVSGYELFLIPDTNEFRIARHLNGVVRNLFTTILPGGVLDNGVIAFRGQVINNQDGQPVIKGWVGDITDNDTPVNGVNGTIDGDNASQIEFGDRAAIISRRVSGIGPTFDNIQANQEVVLGNIEVISRVSPEQEITPPSANSITTVSGNFIAQDASAAIIRVTNTGTIARSFKAWSQNIAAPDYITMRPGVSFNWIVPISSFRDFNVEVDSTEVKMQLIGLINDSQSIVATSPIPLSITMDGTDKTVDLSSYTSGQTAVMAFVKIATSGTRSVDIHAVGSTDDNYTQQNGTFQYPVKLINNQFVFRGQDANVSAELVGLLLSGVVPNDNKVEKAVTVGSYQTETVSAGMDAAIFSVVNDNASLSAGARTKGQVIDYYNVIPAKRAGFYYIPANENGEYEIKRESESAHVFVEAEINQVSVNTIPSDIRTIDNDQSGFVKIGTGWNKITGI